MKQPYFLIALAIVCLGTAAFAKDPATLIDLSVAADGSCQAKIGDAVLAVPGELDAKLPVLLPDKKAPLRFAASYERVPYRCFGPVFASLQRLGYDSVSFATEPPPLGPDVTSPNAPQ